MTAAHVQRAPPLHYTRSVQRCQGSEGRLSRWVRHYSGARTPSTTVVDGEIGVPGAGV